MFTDTMTIGEKLLSGLGLTILGMVVVFSVLIILSFALDLLRIVAGENKKKVVPNQEVKKSQPTISEASVKKEQEDEELIAVIAAAIASISGASIEDILVKSIKPIPQKSSIWGTTGRQQQMLDKM